MAGESLLAESRSRKVLFSSADEKETNYSVSNGHVLPANKMLPSSGLIQYELKKSGKCKSTEIRDTGRILVANQKNY